MVQEGQLAYPCVVQRIRPRPQPPLPPADPKPLSSVASDPCMASSSQRADATPKTKKRIKKPASNPASAPKQDSKAAEATQDVIEGVQKMTLAPKEREPTSPAQQAQQTKKPDEGDTTAGEVTPSDCFTLTQVSPEKVSYF